MNKFWSRLIRVIFKFFIYLLYTLIVAVVLNKTMNIRYLDGVCICGVVLIIIGYIKITRNSSSIPIMAPPSAGRQSSANWVSNMRANIEIRESERDLDMERIGNNILSTNRVVDILFKRDGLEIILYGIILFVTVFIKYMIEYDF